MSIVKYIIKVLNNMKIHIISILTIVLISSVSVAYALTQVGDGTDGFINSAEKFFFDGGSDTYVIQTNNDRLDYFLGNNKLYSISGVGSNSLFIITSQANENTEFRLNTAGADTWRLVTDRDNRGLNIGFFQDEAISIYQNGTMALNKNTGIGTTQPSEALDVVGNIKLSGSVVSDGDICIGNCP